MTALQRSILFLLSVVVSSTSAQNDTTAPTVAPSAAAMPSDFPSLVPSSMPSGASFGSMQLTSPPTVGEGEGEASNVTNTTTMTLVPISVPTLAPTFSACNLCPEDMSITIPDATFTNFLFNNMTTCAEEAARAATGYYSQVECMTLQNIADNICGCEMIIDVDDNATTTTDEPTMAPVPSVSDVVESDVPSAVPTTEPLAPTRAPTVRTRAPVAIPPQPLRFNPTAAPTGQRYSVTGLVYIQLSFVADAMPQSVQGDFNTQVTEFFRRTLLNLPSPIFVSDARLLEQDLTTTATSAAAPTNDLKPLLILVQVKGQTESLSVSEEMNWILFYAVLNDPDGLGRLLRQSSGSGANLYFRLVDQVEAFNVDTFNRAPAAAPGQDVPNDDDDGDDWSTGKLVGVIVGVGVGAGLLVGVLCTVGRGMWAEDYVEPQRRPSATKSKPATMQADIPSDYNDDDDNNKNHYDNNDDQSSASSAPPPARAPPAQASVVTASVVSAAQSSAVQTGGSDSVMDSETGDNMSYAYSLDAGNVDNQTAMTPADSSATSNPLGTGESTLDDQTTEFSARPNMVSRTVSAPPGKLGIVIDTTLEGPVIHKVNPGSPLEGSVYAGDIIVAIDNVDTRAMSASAITALMVKTANQERKLTVLSEEEQETT